MSSWLELTAGVALLAAVLSGWGALATRALAARRRGEAGRSLGIGPLDCGVVGLAPVFILGALASFVWGLPAVASDLAVAVGVAGCLAAITLRWWNRRVAARQALLALALAAFGALGARWTPLSFDTGLYHLQQLEWLRSGPLPFGLANLHDRFGFNSAWMTVSALLGGTRADADATYLLSAALMALVCGALLWHTGEIARLRRLTVAASVRALVLLLWMATAAHGAFGWFGLSPANDLPAALLAIYAVTTGVALLAGAAREPRWAPAPGLVLTFAVSGAMAVTVKLSQAPIALAVASALAWLGFVRGRAERRTVKRATLVAIAVGLVWTAQNLALSGCVAYPVAGTCLGVLPWSVGPASAAKVSEIVLAWARAPGPDFLQLSASGAWPRAWVERMLPERRMLHDLALAIPALLLALLAGRWATRRWPRADVGRGGLLWGLAASSVGVAACVLSAPDPRFAYGSLVLLGAGLLACCVRPVEAVSRRRARRLLAAAIVPVLLAAGWALIAAKRSAAASSTQLAWRVLPEPAHTMRQLEGGLAVRVPVGTEQCWGLPLPCAPAGGRALRAEIRRGRWTFSPPAVGDARPSNAALARPSRWRAALVERWHLLGLEVAPLLALFGDALLLAWVSAWSARRLCGEECPPLRRALATALVLLALVVGGTTALGAFGALSNRTLWFTHLVAFAALFGIDLARRGLREAVRESAAVMRYPVAGVLRAASASWRRRSPPGGWRSERLLLAALAGVLGLYAVLAIGTQPLNWDANTYRLPRIALWLQQGSLDRLPTNDPRLNYVGQNADLLMLWIVSFFRRAFPLVHLVQFGSGLLACFATVAIGGQLGLSRRARLAAALTLLGIPTFGLQMFTAQTDLFVAGALAAGLAFLLPALRHQRPADWILLGLGVGVAVGAKGTVLYWGVGLVGMLIAWAIVERTPPRRLLAGAAIAAIVALPLCAFNFVQNARDYGNPFAPSEVIGRVHQPGAGGETPEALEPAPAAPRAAAPAPVWPPAVNAVAMVWQLFEPFSNPLLPERWIAPPFEGMLRYLAPRQLYYPGLLRSFEASGGWSSHGLSEDEASFGLLVTFAALLGGCLAAVHFAVRRRADDARWAALAAAVALFFVVYSIVSWMSLYQFRYFNMVAPFVALVAVDGVRRLRGVSGRTVAITFVLAQTSVALYLGAVSEYHGLRSLARPQRSQYYAHWQDPHELIRGLGEKPLAIGIALPRDAWLAPLVRSGVDHRVRMVTEEELATSRSVADFMDAGGLDAMIFSPFLAPPFGEGLRAQPASRLFTFYRRVAVRRLRAGESSRPFVALAISVMSDRWTLPRALFRVEGWRGGPFELEVGNPSPLERRVELSSQKARAGFTLRPGVTRRLAVEVGEHDLVDLRVTPPFVPAEHHAVSDRRELGVFVAPEAVREVVGIDGDGWTAPQARWRVVNWLSGLFELDVSNPAATAREVVLHSAVESVTLRLGGGESGRLTVAVLPHDELELRVTPPISAAMAGGGDADRRQLGALLAGAAGRQLVAARRP